MTQKLHMEFLRKDNLLSINFSKFDVIINCAAEVYDEKKMLQNNCIIPFQICEKILKENKNCKLIHFGTSLEYGKNDKAHKENFILKPDHLYASTKSAATLMTQSFSKQYDVKSIIIRPYSVYGPFENSSRLLPNIFRNIIFGKEINIFNGYHDFVYIDELMIFLKFLIKTKMNIFDGRIINFGSGKQLSNIDVFNKVTKVLKKEKSNFKMIRVFNRKYDNKNWKANISVYKKFDIKKISFENGILRYYRFLKKNKKSLIHLGKFNNNNKTELI